MSIQRRPLAEVPAGFQEVEALSNSAHRALHQIAAEQKVSDRYRAEAGHWRFLTWIFLSLFTVHLLLDLVALAWWWTRS